MQGPKLEGRRPQALPWAGQTAREGPSSLLKFTDRAGGRAVHLESLARAVPTRIHSLA